MGGGGRGGGEGGGEEEKRENTLCTRFLYSTRIYFYCFENRNVCCIAVVDNCGFIINLPLEKKITIPPDPFSHVAVGNESGLCDWLSTCNFFSREVDFLNFEFIIKCILYGHINNTR